MSSFLPFLNSSPSPFHAVQQTITLLHTHNFTQLQPREHWALKPGGRYYTIRNQSAIIAFTIGNQWKAGDGVAIIGAHTDSPCLKLKPVSKKENQGYLQVGVQTYGGGLWHTWFDRDLGIAGKVIVQEQPGGELKSRLVRIHKPILRVPNLAIHLTRSGPDKGFDPNKESNMLPILATLNKVRKAAAVEPESKNVKDAPVHHPILLETIAKELGLKQTSSIKDFELCLYDTQDAVIGGLMDEFIFGPRLDNLMMSYTSIMALVQSLGSKNSGTISMVALFDDEEVGSASAYGAGSNFLEEVLRRVVQTDPKADPDLLDRTRHNSYMISADMAHAVHPNYSDKHEENHRPKMHEGVVIKTNANQRYATTSETSAILKEVALLAGVPLQEFVVKNDSPCGSTIGPILSTNTGIRTIDVGIPQLAMHSIREMCGVDDIQHAIELFITFFQQFERIDKSFKS